jgi:hypothetical protein
MLVSQATGLIARSVVQISTKMAVSANHAKSALHLPMTLKNDVLQEVQKTS